MELRRLNLVFSPVLEDAVIAALLDMPDLPGLTTLHGEGHGSSFDKASSRERVRGRVARDMAGLVLPAERVDDVLDGLRQRLPGADIRWWSEIVERFGRLA